MHQNEAYNFTIRRNIFDRSDANVINIVAADAKRLPQMEGNTYVQYLGGDGGRIGQPWADYKFDEQFPASVEQALGEKGGKYIFIIR